MDTFLDDFLLLIRVKKIFDRYCLDGKRPSREEAADWLKSLGWQPAPMEKLLRAWGYEDEILQ